MLLSTSHAAHNKVHFVHSQACPTSLWGECESESLVVLGVFSLCTLMHWVYRCWNIGAQFYGTSVSTHPIHQKTVFYKWIAVTTFSCVKRTLTEVTILPKTIEAEITKTVQLTCKTPLKIRKKKLDGELISRCGLCLPVPCCYCTTSMSERKWTSLPIWASPTSRGCTHLGHGLTGRWSWAR